MKTIVAIAQLAVWERALKNGEYRQSTIDSTFDEIGFIHCSSPQQVIDTANRHFAKRDLGPLVLLFIDVGNVNPPIKFERPLSGRKGEFPHVYGPLNTDAVYSVVPLEKDIESKFKAPQALEDLLANKN